MPKLSIKIKVLILLLSLITIMIVVMVLNMQRGFDKGFFNYRKAIDQQFHNNLIKTLKEYHQHNNTWDDLYDNRRLWHDLLNRSAVDFELMDHKDKGMRKRPKRVRKHPRDQHMHQRDQRIHQRMLAEKAHEKQMHRRRLLPPVGLYDQDKSFIIGRVDDRSKNIEFLKIAIEQNTIGYLGISNNNIQHRAQDKRFVANIKSMLLQLALIMLALALILTFPIAKYFTKLIKQLTKGTQKMAKGDYSTRIHSNRQDELGDLAKNFNHLAKTLQHNASAQKNMMADIAHELRTPIAVVLAEIEAIQDGIHQADQKTLALMHTQMSSLVSLVGDLHDLSESDLGSLKYQMQNCDLLAIIKSCYHNYQLKLTHKNIHCEIIASQQNYSITGDTKRLTQLFNNLLSNAVHYTNEGGKVQILISTQEQQVVIVVQDSAPGLNPQQLTKIFDRWYRAEQSRNRKLGGSGLGLAICEKIVTAHHGTITAQHSSLGGVAITITLPRDYIQ